MSDEAELRIRDQLAAVDQAVLTEAAAGREQELALRNSDNERIVRVERIRAEALADRRRWIGLLLAVLAGLVLAAGLMVAFWTASAQDRQKELRKERLQQQTAAECIRVGNIWYDGNCLLATKVGAAAPAANRPKGT